MSSLQARIPKFDDATIEVEPGMFDPPMSEDEVGLRYFVSIVEKSGYRTSLADFKDYYEAIEFAHETAAQFGVPNVVDLGDEMILLDQGDQQ